MKLPLLISHYMQAFACDNPVGTAAANALPCSNQDVIEKVEKLLRRESFFFFENIGFTS
jgi:hypothetical protein